MKKHKLDAFKQQNERTLAYVNRLVALLMNLEKEALCTTQRMVYEAISNRVSHIEENLYEMRKLIEK